MTTPWPVPPGSTRWWLGPRSWCGKAMQQPRRFRSFEPLAQLGIRQGRDDARGGLAGLGEQRIVAVGGEQRGRDSQEQGRIADRACQRHGGSEVGDRLLLPPQSEQ